MTHALTPVQALQILKQCAEQAPLPYVQHVVVQQAAMLLHQTISGPENEVLQG